MNTTVLALQEEQVLVAVGKSGAQPSDAGAYSAPHTAAAWKTGRRR